MLRGAIQNLLYKLIDENSKRGKVTKVRVPLVLYFDMVRNKMIGMDEETPIMHFQGKESGVYYSVIIEMSPELKLSCEIENYVQAKN